MKKRILSMLCILALTVSLCACGAPSPTEVTGQFLDAFKAQDSETLKDVYANPDEIGDFSQLLDAADLTDESMPKTAAYFKESVMPKLFEFDYELSNEKVDGDKATVDAAITTYAFGDAFTAAMTDIMSQIMVLAFSDPSDDQVDVTMRDAFKKHFDTAEKSYTTTITVNLTKKDDSWVVDDIGEDEIFADAFLGGLMKAAENLDVLGE